MTDIPLETERPWRVVVTTDGNFHSGHMTEEAARHRSAEANAAATDLGITTRYEVKETS